MKVEKLWNLKCNEPILGIKLGDINNNGQIEAVAYTKSGKLLIISLSGTILRQVVISQNSPIWHLEINDLNNDNQNDLIIGGLDGVLKTFKVSSTYNLASFWNHKLGASISGILINDVNNNSQKEIIVFSLDKTIRVLDALNGAIVWGQVFEDEVGDAIIYNDKNIQSTKELIACGNDWTLRAFNGYNGQLLWFKRFSNKLRCLAYLNSIRGPLILCGGDDQKIHCIQINNQREIKTLDFNNYVWKCHSYPHQKFNKIIISSYSFIFFNNSIPLQNLDFTSKLIALNENLEVLWELIGINVEFLDIIEVCDKIFILAGTTKGEVLIVDEFTGKIVYRIRNESLTNMVQFHLEQRLILSCHDDGGIFAYKLEDIID